MSHTVPSCLASPCPTPPSTRRILALLAMGTALTLLSGCRRTPAHRAREAASTATHSDPALTLLRSARPAGTGAPGRGVAARNAMHAPATPARNAMHAPATPARAVSPDAPKVYGGRKLRLPRPVPITLERPGATPRLALRYRLPQGTTYAWSVESRQRTLLRAETQCPALGAPPSAKRPHRTLIAGYRLTLRTTVAKSLPTTLVLTTRFADVHLTLPPSLEDRRALLTSLVAQTGYRVRMSPRGQIHLFELGRLAPKEVGDVLGEMKTPLGTIQPVYPEVTVGPGAIWRQRTVLPFHPVSGTYQARYDTEYHLIRVTPASRPAVAIVTMRTSIQVRGKLMGKPLVGSGTSSARAEVDLATGLSRSIRGETHICTAVLGQTSTNHTSFSQRLLPPSSSTASRPAPSRSRAAPGPRAAGTTGTHRTAGPRRPPRTPRPR